MQACTLNILDYLLSGFRLLLFIDDWNHGDMYMKKITLPYSVTQLSQRFYEWRILDVAYSSSPINNVSKPTTQIIARKSSLSNRYHLSRNMDETGVLGSKKPEFTFR
jgi:hypothetical protein